MKIVYVLMFYVVVVITTTVILTVRDSQEYSNSHFTTTKTVQANYTPPLLNYEEPTEMVSYSMLLNSEERVRPIVRVVVNTGRMSVRIFGVERRVERRRNRGGFFRFFRRRCG